MLWILGLLACGGDDPCGEGASLVDGNCEARITVTACPDLPEPRDHLGTVRLDQDGTTWLLATGGLDFGREGVEAQRAFDTLYYAEVAEDGTVGTWQTGQLPEARAGHGIAVHGGRVVVLGGLVDFGTAGSPTVEDWVSTTFSGVFDPTSGTLTDVRDEADLPEALWHLQATGIDGELVVVGGRSAYGEASTLSVRAVLDGDRITAWEPWSLTLDTGRTHHGMAVHEGQVFLAGGLSAQSDPMAAVLRGDLAAPGAFTRSTLLETARITPGVMVLGDLLVVAGGLDSAASATATLEAFPVGADLPWSIDLDELPEGIGHVHQVPVVGTRGYVIGGRPVPSTGERVSTTACSVVAL